MIFLKVYAVMFLMLLGLATISVINNENKAVSWWVIISTLISILAVLI